MRELTWSVKMDPPEGYSRCGFLVTLHNFGVVTRKQDIPARPLRRVVSRPPPHARSPIKKAVNWWRSRPWIQSTASPSRTTPFPSTWTPPWLYVHAMLPPCFSHPNVVERCLEELRALERMDLHLRSGVACLFNEERAAQQGSRTSWCSGVHRNRSQPKRTNVQRHCSEMSPGVSKIPSKLTILVQVSPSKTDVFWPGVLIQCVFLIHPSTPLHTPIHLPCWPSDPLPTCFHLSELAPNPKVSRCGSLIRPMGRAFSGSTHRVPLGRPFSICVRTVERRKRTRLPAAPPAQGCPPHPNRWGHLRKWADFGGGPGGPLEEDLKLEFGWIGHDGLNPWAESDQRNGMEQWLFQGSCSGMGGDFPELVGRIFNLENSWATTAYCFCYQWTHPLTCLQKRPFVTCLQMAARISSGQHHKPSWIVPAHHPARPSDLSSDLSCRISLSVRQHLSVQSATWLSWFWPFSTHLKSWEWSSPTKYIRAPVVTIRGWILTDTPWYIYICLHWPLKRPQLMDTDGHKWSIMIIYGSPISRVWVLTDPCNKHVVQTRYPSSCSVH